MLKLSKFKLLGVVAVLVALLTAVGGLVISQAAGRAVQRPRSISPRSKDVGHWTLDRFKAEVFNLSGKRLFDSGPVMGKALDWNMSTESGERIAQELRLPGRNWNKTV